MLLSSQANLQRCELHSLGWLAMLASRPVMDSVAIIFTFDTRNGCCIWIPYVADGGTFVLTLMLALSDLMNSSTRII